MPEQRIQRKTPLRGQPSALLLFRGALLTGSKMPSARLLRQLAPYERKLTILAAVGTRLVVRLPDEVAEDTRIALGRGLV